jgi:hypothetical protein
MICMPEMLSRGSARSTLSIVFLVLITCQSHFQVALNPALAIRTWPLTYPKRLHPNGDLAATWVASGRRGGSGLILTERVGFVPTPAQWLPQLVETTLPRLPNLPPSPRTIARHCTLAGKYSASSFRLGSGQSHSS